MTRVQELEREIEHSKASLPMYGKTFVSWFLNIFPCCGATRRAASGTPAAAINDSLGGSEMYHCTRRQGTS